MNLAVDHHIETWLQDWFNQRAPELCPQPGENYFDKGVIDSFGAIELIEEVETEFSIRFTEQDFQDRRFATIDGLTEIIHEKRKMSH